MIELRSLIFFSFLANIFAIKDESKRQIFLEGRPPEHPLHCETEPEFRWWIPNRPHPPVELTEVCLIPGTEHLVRSKHAGQWTVVHFLNEANRPVVINYVNEDGNFFEKAFLLPNQRASLDTMEGHVFVVTDEATKRPLMRHTVGTIFFGGPESDDWGNCDGEEFQEMIRDPCADCLECGFVSRGMVNFSPCKLNIFYFNGTHESFVAHLDVFGSMPGDATTNEPLAGKLGKQYHYEGTYITHQFFARLPSGRLMQEKRINRITINNCFEPILNRTEAALSEEKIPRDQLTFPTITRRVLENGDLGAVTKVAGEPITNTKTVTIDDEMEMKVDGSSPSAAAASIVKIGPEDIRSHNTTTVAITVGAMIDYDASFSLYVPPILLDMTGYVLSLATRSS